MARDPNRGKAMVACPRLDRLNRGDILGQVPRSTAERGYALYRERRVASVLWTGDALESALSVPSCSVQVTQDSRYETPCSTCSACGPVRGPCAHAVATLLQWLDIRPTMQRMGPGTLWRGNSRHPFLAPSRPATDRVDLSHLSGADLRAALELQLSLQRTGTAPAKLVDGEVQVQVTLPSGDRRLVVFTAAVLPGVLPLLRSMTRLKLDGELAGLELSEARLQPVLEASWDGRGIALSPGYRLAEGTVLPIEEIAPRVHGRWAQVGGRLCRVLDPATPLVPFFRRGAQILAGREALRFLNLDHPQLCQHGWYMPRGTLATFRRAVLPKPKALLVEGTRSGKIRLRAVFSAGGHDLDWPKIVDLIGEGFTRVGDVILRAPELAAFERAGFRRAGRSFAGGMLGDRLALIRLVAESRLPVITSDPALDHLAAVLHGEAIPDVGDPPGLRSHLRPYQREGVAFLASRWTARVGVLLADDMGLGKTHQMMGLMCLIRDEDPSARFLVVCPRGVLEHWHHLLTTFAPHLEPHVFHGSDRSLDVAGGGARLVLTTYDILIRSTDDLLHGPWQVAVFDEAQRIKNPRTKSARAARRVVAELRVALSGTPLENRLTELWSVVDLVMPGYLGSERDFRQTYRSPTQGQLARLRRRVGVLTLRRLKEQVLSDLPEKVEDLRYCRLTSGQEALYHAVHSRQAAELSALLADPAAEVPVMHILAALTRLKQVCDHPALLDDGSGRHLGSAKMEVLDELLDEALSGSHQVVVFSQYVAMLAILSRHLETRKIRHLLLTGNTRDRGRVVRRFNSGQHEPVLLASLLAGGIGIDLTGASVVIHYDRWWNPAKEDQATDRVHRIGQRRFVQVFKLIVRGTIEENIDLLIQRKRDLMETVVAPTGDVLKGLSRRELAELLDLPID
jgi:superfamily II DNA or RNA helicase